MTEAQWLRSDRVLTPLMNWLRSRGSNRQFYLTAAGWVRQVEDKMTLPCCKALLSLVEQYADGLMTSDDLSHRMRAAEDDVLDQIMALSVGSADGNSLAAD